MVIRYGSRKAADAESGKAPQSGWSSRDRGLWV